MGKITIISGSPLTPTNKKHILLMISQNIFEGKINSIYYSLVKNADDTIEVIIKKRDRGLGFIGNELRLSTYKTIVKLN